jgi:ABC-type antimicrobial peptide transport system permease subunit
MVSFVKLLLRTVAFHWRGNLAVVLGVAIGSAILTGALLVGDSLRGSLRSRVERQLAGIDAVLMLPRPVRLELAEGLPGTVAPVLLIPGTITVETNDPLTAPYLNRVTILGIDSRFKPASSGSELINWNGSSRQVVLSSRVAQKLGVTAGERVRLGVERFTDLPRGSAFGKRSTSDVTTTDEFTIAKILNPDDPLEDFNLTPNPAAPLNVLVPLQALTRLATEDNQPRMTALFATAASLEELNASLRARLRPEDYGLKMREIERRGYLSIESTELILPPWLVDSVLSAAAELKLRAEPTVIYVADSIKAGPREIPYPVIAGLNAAAAEPLGPFLPPDVTKLDDNEVILLDWAGSELTKLPTGTRLQLAYYHPEVEGEGRLEQAELILRGYIPLQGAARDRDLTPEIRGVTDARAELQNWDRPPVLPKEKIQARVPDKHPRATFFNINKATPMAYVNLATAQRLFGSRYGSITSIRIAPENGESLDQLAERLNPVLLKKLDPQAGGFVFDPIRTRLLAASKGGNDFGGLFLGFSIFLIAAALMLVGLLFRLTLERRAKEVGLLLAVGFPVNTIRRLMLLEGGVLSCVGSLIGLAIGIGYNNLLLMLLQELWPDPEMASILQPHATAGSFLLGFALTVLMSLLAIWLSVRGLIRVSPPALLRGVTTEQTLAEPRRSRVGWWLLGCSVPTGLVLVLVGGGMPNPDYQAMMFFSGGALLLIAGLSAFGLWMTRTRRQIVHGRGVPALVRLGSTNTARNPNRSLLTVALLAAAAFLLLAVESFRRQTGSEFLERTGGSGGFNLLAEADLPLYESFGTGPGRVELDQHIRKAKGDPTLLEGMEVVPFRLRDGDDASCMNLFQASRPRVLGVPQSLIQRGGFQFYSTAARTTDEEANPWLLLNRAEPDGAIPVICEQSTAQWMLKKAVGDDVKLTAEDGSEFTGRIVGTLVDSPFQSEVLISEDAFIKHFPKSPGYRLFLIQTSPSRERELARLLSVGLRAYGLVVSSTRERVATYQAVIGAYLSTFQVLGGLGLLLGVVGLAIVVLRAVWERIGELAVLRAVGYRANQLQLLILSENTLLLVIGLCIGIVAAFISVAPHVATGATVPWLRLGLLFGLIILVGLAVAATATASILRVPVIPALRKE